MTLALPSSVTRKYLVSPPPGNTSTALAMQHIYYEEDPTRIAAQIAGGHLQLFQVSSQAIFSKFILLESAAF